MQQETKKTRRVLPRAQIIHAITLIISLISALWYFFNLICFAICFSYIFFDKDARWKLNGVIIAFSSGLGSYLSVIFKEVLAPLTMMGIITYSGIEVYAITLLLGKIDLMVSQKKQTKRIFEGLIEKMRILDLSSKFGKAIVLIFGMVLPMGLWVSVNVNWDVLTNNSPQMIWIHAPTTPELASEFEFSVQIWDKYERLSASYLGSVEFDLISYNFSTLDLLSKSTVNFSLPNKYTFTGQKPGYITDSAYLIIDGKDNGMRTFKGQITTPGIHYIVVRDVSNGSVNVLSKIPHKNAEFYSNPIIIFDSISSMSKIY